ncbi:MAG TPA: hypothetical protein DC047_10210 [Blastocatellia bacterium]|nr:hypothetical protein [Blastocatellia bacterium]
MGAVIVDWQVLISDCCLAIGPIDNRQSQIGNVGTHPLPRTVLTSLPLRGLYFKLQLYHYFAQLVRSAHSC